VDFLERLRPFTLLVLRIAVGIIFIYHGYDKYTHGIGATKAMMGGAGLPTYFAYISIAIELGGGALLLLGFLTRPIGALLSIEMAVAIVKVHLAHGIGSVPHYEFPLAMCVASLAIATFGAGKASLDYAFFGKPRPLKPRNK